MLAAPRMWGSLEAVELQILCLLQVRHLAVHGQDLSKALLDRHVEVVRKRFGPGPKGLAWDQVGDDEALFVELMWDVVAALRDDWGELVKSKLKLVD